MNFQKITHFDTANGTDVGVVLWVSGCEHHCLGCHNPGTWDRHSGTPFTSADLRQLLSDLDYHYIHRLTISGGDPLMPYNRDEVANICSAVRDRYPSKKIWIYTGYLWEDIRTLDAVQYADVLVDGPFIQARRNVGLPYCGSENQRVIDVQHSLGFDTPITLF